MKASFKLVSDKILKKQLERLGLEKNRGRDLELDRYINQRQYTIYLEKGFWDVPENIEDLASFMAETEEKLSQAQIPQNSYISSKLEIAIPGMGFFTARADRNTDKPNDGTISSEKKNLEKIIAANTTEKVLDWIGQLANKIEEKLKNKSDRSNLNNAQKVSETPPFSL